MSGTSGWVCGWLSEGVEMSRNRLGTLLIGLGMGAALSVSVLPARGQTAPPKLLIETYEDHSNTMKEIASQSAVLRKIIATPSDPAVPTAAARLEVLFKGIQGYWENKKADDAVAETKSAVAALQSLSAAAASNDAAAAATAFQQMNATCGACHKAHRDRLTYDFYRIK